MNTTISPNGLPALPQTKTNQGSNNGSQAGTTVASGSSSAQADDSVKLTDSARALQQASSTNAQSPVDTARVEQIRKSLTDGTYSVNAGKIADGLTSLESQINGTP
jgi:negative regulator of flagellin synthesis FlgM